MVGGHKRQFDLHGLPMLTTGAAGDRRIEDYDPITV